MNDAWIVYMLLPNLGFRVYDDDVLETEFTIMQCYKNGQLIDSIPLLIEPFIMEMVAFTIDFSKVV